MPSHRSAQATTRLPATELIITYRGQEQTLRVKDEDVITFPDGFVGFEDWRRFVLLEDPDEAPLGILYCIDHPEVSFVITDPWQVYADYQLSLSEEQMKHLEIDKIEESRALCILAAKEGPVRVTANLLAPIVINPRARIARQIILQNSNYSVQHPVLMATTESE